MTWLALMSIRPQNEKTYAFKPLQEPTSMNIVFNHYSFAKAGVCEEEEDKRHKADHRSLKVYKCMSLSILTPDAVMLNNAGVIQATS